MIFRKSLRKTEDDSYYGTNGKGSTSNMLASVLQEQGYNVGLYNSPHLIDFTERIKINGNNCEKEFVFDFIQN